MGCGDFKGEEGNARGDGKANVWKINVLCLCCLDQQRQLDAVGVVISRAGQVCAPYHHLPYALQTSLVVALFQGQSFYLNSFRQLGGT